MDEFFLPEEVEKQIESVSKFKKGDRRAFTRPMPSRSKTR